MVYVLHILGSFVKLAVYVCCFGWFFSFVVDLGAGGAGVGFVVVFKA